MKSSDSQSRSNLIVTGLAWLALVLIGLMAGFFYAYSATVMIGLGNASDTTFIDAMQQINANVRNTWFGIGFFGSLIVSLVATIVTWLRGRKQTAIWLTLAFVLYGAAFVITFSQSVPLNDQLADAGLISQISDPASVRNAYEDVWNRWNDARTVLSTLALVAMGGAMRSLKHTIR